MIKEKEKYEKWAQMLGINLGMTFQKNWFNFLQGKGVSVKTTLMSKAIKIIQKENAIFFTIPNAQFRDFPENVWKPLLNGFLSGLLKTFQLPEAEMVESAIHTEWRINL